MMGAVQIVVFVCKVLWRSLDFLFTWKEKSLPLSTYSGTHEQFIPCPSKPSSSLSRYPARNYTPPYLVALRSTIWAICQSRITHTVQAIRPSSLPYSCILAGAGSPRRQVPGCWKALKVLEAGDRELSPPAMPGHVAF